MSLLKFINLLSNDNKMSLSKIYQGELIHERKRYYDHYERIYKDCEIFQCENINYQYEVDKSNDMIKSEVFVDGENRVDENVRRSKVAKIRITESIVEIIKYISDKLDLIILPTSNTFDYIVYDKNDFLPKGAPADVIAPLKTKKIPEIISNKITAPKCFFILHIQLMSMGRSKVHAF